MAGYAVVGKLGTGKTKFCVWRAQEALRDGRRVASNVDMDLSKLTPERRRTYTRVPDKPTTLDLDLIGHGNPDSYDEDNNGLLILDELGTWLNARTFNDKARSGVIDWLLHARKKGWDVYLICQDDSMIDKQARVSSIEHTVTCRALNKIKVPLFGSMLQLFLGKKAGYLPRMHVAASRIGDGVNAILAERWWFTGKHLHAAYDTRQEFLADYPHAVHTVLTPWDWQPELTLLDRLRGWWMAFTKVKATQRTLKPKHPLVRKIQRLLPEAERPRHVQRLARLGLI